MPAAAPVIEKHRCNCTALRKASRRLSQFYDAMLAPCGLRSTQSALLAEIDRRSAPPTLRELAEALVMDRSTLGQNLRPLERDGLVRVEAGAADRRRRLVTLTSDGRARLADIQILWHGAQRRFEDRFGAQAAADLRRVLRGIAEDRGLAVADAAPHEDPA